MTAIVRTRGDNGEHLENGVWVETCTDRHAGPECVTVADWCKAHPFGVHPMRQDPPA